MADVFIAAAPDADAQAGGLAQALKTLGFDAAAGAPAEADIAKIVDDAKCVIGLWSRGAPTAELAMLAALAHERKKLVSAELVTDATPAPFRGAPRVDLALRDRTAFKPPCSVARFIGFGGIRIDPHIRSVFSTRQAPRLDCLPMAGSIPTREWSSTTS